ncbi:centrosome and spindle pole associated protein 1 isoform X2 [Strongylocentrotus purpuratus]|uniref:Centrosome and spindle pole-associated protein 1 C-terminal domain-containing protein n=1 Tax=Strongylocentrotus purpuratus TaxID=7668 RepID=A0A7M7NM28_STRPU|nr:centrosome and spindle pole associated protein 1 isoform X2 [Strongylocentrotus purpuratus]
MSAEDDIDRFIQQQKRKIAREREDLQHSNEKQISVPLSNGYPNGDIVLKENRPPKPLTNQHKGHKQSDEPGLPVGNYITTKEKLQKEREAEYRRFIQEKNNRSSTKRTNIEGDGMSLPIGERLSAQDRARSQRNKEYNDFLKQKGGSRRKGQDQGTELTNGGGQHQSASGPPNSYGQQQPSNGYNQHQPLSQYQQGNDSYNAPRLQQEASSQTPVPRGYDDLPPRAPRKGWATPQPLEYDDILRRKREEEKRYRQYDDIDFYRPRLKPAHSDPYLNRYEEDGRRSSRPEYYDDYDRRRVRFSDEVTPPAPRDGPSYSDRLTRPRQRESLEEPILYDWSQSKGGRSRTFTDGDRRKPALKQDDLERPPRAKSATLPVDTGLPLGQRDTGSATRRKKEQYRKELEQQMEEAKAAKKREKAMDQSPGFPGSTKPSAAQVQQPPPQSYTPSFHQQQQQQYGNRPQPVSTTPYPGSQYGIQDIQSQVPSYNAGSRPYSQIAQPKEPIGDLGLKEALAKSQPKLLERPFSLNYPQPSTINQPSTNTDPYMYYGMRNPLEPDPNPKSQAGKIWVGEMTKSLSNLGGMVHGLPHSAAADGSFSSPIMERYLLLQKQQQQLLQQQQQLEQQFPSSLIGPNQLNQQLSNPVLSKQAAAQFRGESAIQNFVGDSNLSPRSQANAPSYREQLLIQMKEKENKKNVENAAKAAYEAKIEKEIEVYDPWGKGGAGAPMRDKKGKIVADLKQLHNRNETILNDPNRKDLQLYAGSANAPPTNPAAALGPGQEVSPLLAAAALAGGGPGPGPGLAPGPAYGRIKGSITGAVPDAAADSSRNEYQDQLRQQVEDKKRRELEEKEKIRLEEEKEEKRLAAQRDRIQKEYNAEIERKKQKEEMQRKQKEDLEKQLEDKRKEADEKKKGANEKRRREADEKLRNTDINQNVNNLSLPRGTSPPIPTLRTKEPELQRISSPPIPTHQKKEETKRPPPQPARRSTQSPPVPTLQKRDKKVVEPDSQDNGDRTDRSQKKGSRRHSRAPEQGDKDHQKTPRKGPSRNEEGEKNRKSRRSRKEAHPDDDDDGEISPGKTPRDEEGERTKRSRRPRKEATPNGDEETPREEDRNDGEETPRKPRKRRPRPKQEDDPLNSYAESTGKSGSGRARIFPPKDISKQHAELDPLDKFRNPAPVPEKSNHPRVIPKENARLSPLEKLRNHYPEDPHKSDSLLDSGLFPETKGGFEAAYKKQRYLVDWLRELDPDLVVYAAPLAENGYKTWNTIRRLKRGTLLDLCPDIKHGHVEAILHEVNRGQTPRSKKPQVRSPDSLSEQELDIADIESSKTRPAPIRRKEKPRRDDDFPSASERSSSPPVPAVSTKERGGPKDETNVVGALSAMRVQLAYEQQRIQSQLDKHRDYDPYNPMPKAAHAPRRGSPQVDVFELARHKGSVAVMRNMNHQAAEDFDGLKDRSGSRTRQKVKKNYPNKPDSDVNLEAQQMALLREQQEKLEAMRKGRKATTNDIPRMTDIGRGSPAIPLDSDSAFIGIDSGETHMPKTASRPTRSSAVPSPVNSQPRKTGRSVSRLDHDDLDKIIAKSQARSDAIETLHDHDSDPDDILNKFLSKKSYDSRPPSGKSEDLSLWLKPSLGQT